MLRKGRESVDAVNARADDAYQRGQARYGEAKVCLSNGLSPCYQWRTNGIVRI